MVKLLVTITFDDNESHSITSQVLEFDTLQEAINANQAICMNYPQAHYEVISTIIS